MGLLVSGHVDRMTAVPRSTRVDLDVRERQRSGLLVGAEDPVLGTVMNDAVLDGDVVPVMEDAARLPAGDLESLHHVVICVKVHGVHPAGEHGALSPRRSLAHEGDLLRGCAALRERDIARVRLAAVDLDDVARSELGCHILQAGKRLSRANLVMGGLRGLRDSKEGNQASDERHYNERRISHQVSPHRAKHSSIDYVQAT